MVATVENVSQSPLAIHVKGAVVRIESGAQAVIDDAKSFAKAAKLFIDANELRFIGGVDCADRKQSKKQAKATEPDKTVTTDSNPAGAANQEPEETKE